jgi:hypothetical protein
VQHQSSQSQLNPVKIYFPNNKIGNIDASPLLYNLNETPKILLLQLTESSLTTYQSNKNEMPHKSKETKARRMQGILCYTELNGKDV